MSEHTPRRSFRIPQPLYDAAKTKALSEGITVTQVVLKALTKYIKGAK